MGPLNLPRAALVVALAALCLIPPLGLAACGRGGAVRLKYVDHADSPDGKRVVFSASCRLGKFGKRLAAPVLARDRDDASTWTQLSDWESYEISAYEWVDGATLRIRGKRRQEKGPGHFRLDSHDGVKVVWAIE